MNRRKRISDSTQAEVLVRSRRRRCICFGLSRDTAIEHFDPEHCRKIAAILRRREGY